MAVPTTLPLLWHAPLRDPSGYADEARAFLLALERAGYAVAAREIAWGAAAAELPAEQRAVLERALAREIPAGGVLVEHRIPLPGDRYRRDELCTVARTMFETDSIPRHWVPALAGADEIWVPSEFNVETFERAGLSGDRICVLPETIDFELFDPARAEPRPLNGLRGFTFLSNFDFTDRKGWDLLLDAWAAAFAADDDVCLLLKCVSLHGLSGPEIEERIRRYLAGRETAPLLVMNELLPAAAMPGLYAAADAFVLPSRGEGWGRPYMEAMAMGLPTIGSRWSGNTAFMHDGNSWLLDGQVVPVESWSQVHSDLYRGHRWFAPDPDALVAALREVRAGGEQVRERAAGARADLLARFGPDAVAARIAELTEAALERGQWRRSRPVACLWRGEWGSIHSLAVVNQGLVGALEADGEVVERALPEAAPDPRPLPGVAQHWPPRFEPPSAGPFVLYQPWEFGEIPQAWVEPIRSGVDEVWTPSEYARQAFVRAGIAPELVHVVPNAVDLERFSPAGPAYALPERAGTVFLFVGGTTYRKGVDVLLSAYARAFSDSDDVLLVVKGFGSDSLYRGMTAEQAIAEFQATPGTPRLLSLDDYLDFDQVPALYRAADCLVQPYRGEGFCLPALEGLACGLPLIVTAGGPTDEFTSEACAWYLPSRRVPLAPAMLTKELWPAGGGFLLEPDVGALVAALREAADPARRAEKAATARVHAERYSWATPAAVVKERLAALAATTPVRSQPPQRLADSQPLLLLGLGDWQAALAAYAEAFDAEAAVTLALPGASEEEALAILAGRDDVADVALVPELDDPTPLVLGADAVVGAAHARARRTVPADPAALRALLAA